MAKDFPLQAWPIYWTVPATGGGGEQRLGESVIKYIYVYLHRDQQ